MHVRIVSLKSYGDFVIAIKSVKKLEHNQVRPPDIIAGEHLRQLALGLKINIPVQFIGDSSYTDVPAAFDVGRRGKIAAFCSLVDLRKKLSPFRNTDDIFLFDRTDLRSFITGFPSKATQLPPCKNIYEAYSIFFESMGYTAKKTVNTLPQKIKSAYIFPTSRISRKNIPKNVLAKTYRHLEASGISAQIITLQGEETGAHSSIPEKVIPRNFSALINVIQTSDMVISADSLAAHLGGYIDRPTFVLTPIENRYWLPEQAFKDNAYAIFEDLTPLHRWIDSMQAKR